MKTSGFKTELNGGRKDDLFEARQAFSSLSTIMTNKVTTITTDLLRNSLHLKVLFKLLFFFFFFPLSRVIFSKCIMTYIFAALLKASPPSDRTKAITWLATHCASAEGEEILDKDIQIESLCNRKYQVFFTVKPKKPGPGW